MSYQWDYQASQKELRLERSYCWVNRSNSTSNLTILEDSNILMYHPKLYQTMMMSQQASMMKTYTKEDKVCHKAKEIQSKRSKKNCRTLRLWLSNLMIILSQYCQLKMNNSNSVSEELVKISLWQLLKLIINTNHLNHSIHQPNQSQLSNWSNSSTMNSIT